MATAERIIEGTRVSRVHAEGVAITEPYRVYDAVGGSPAEKLYDALQATGLPALGTLHPTIPSAFLTEFRGEPAGTKTTDAIVFAIYLAPAQVQQEPDPATDPGTIYTSVTLQEIETRFDRNGNQILLQHDTGTEIVTQPGVATLQIPVVIKGVQRRETTDPLTKAQTHVGKTNSASIWGEAARRWLCTRIDGVSTDFGTSYTVNYEFQRSELLRYSPTNTYSSWDALLVYEDEEGRPIEAPVFGQSMKIIQVYGESDFSVLTLP